MLQAESPALEGNSKEQVCVRDAHTSVLVGGEGVVHVHL